MPDAEWFQGGWLALATSALGASLALIFAFLRWRYHETVLSRTDRDVLTSAQLEVERLGNDTVGEHTASAAELVSICERLEEAVDENDQLRGRLRDLEDNLENVASEAVMLVDSLRVNEQRWEQAEDELRGTETELRRTAAALEEAVARSAALEEALRVERDQTDALGAANQELTEQLQKSRQLTRRRTNAPTVDLRDQDWVPRSWRQRRAQRSFSQSHGTLPD